MQPYLANHNDYATVKLGLNVLVMLSNAWSTFLQKIHINSYII